MKFILRSAFWLVAAYVLLAPAPQREQAGTVLAAGAGAIAATVGAGCVAPICVVGALGAGAIGSGALTTPAAAITSNPSVDPPMQDSSTDPAPMPRPRPDRMG